MTAPSALDRTHHAILEIFVARGTAPRASELAARLGVTPEEGRRHLRDLVATGLPVWLVPGTDRIASCAPFNALPTPYRASVDGRPGWFGQCGLESLALTWAFPGRTVRIDAACLDCGEPLSVVLRDGVLEEHAPAGIVAAVDLPFREWARDWADT